ncbi:cell wall-binding repeat-containing protein [Mobiluncus curtisii]|nr:cell wall-binding repeat-containing protein [Mobiluncus curtisii]MCV0021626.1 cell wall-binding repeat-containing protein [Mobiluncus curtisii]NMW43326.1 cell wall-binding repeat-containing protein [Mobiluncus curtisii]NMW47434.1 cell wall-binding repeat-containing protein [Mobiluncus curtisii]NMW82734.1 cell wall-binding repeat-containing protein [Mobiluncus curtisii]NMX00110.1 cell wall-binding repeat-containing protein [Mobiluncus curtisii]
MNLKKKFVIGAASLALVAGMGVAPAMAADIHMPNGSLVQRVAGDDRVATSVAAAEKFVKDARAEVPARTITTAYVVGNNAIIDAAVSGELTDGAVIVAPKDKGDQLLLGKTMADSADLRGITTLVAIGGKGVVPDATIDNIKKFNSAIVKTERVDGKNRYETAVNIAKRAFKNANPVNVFLTSGANPVDALAAGSLNNSVLLPVNVSGDVDPVLPEYYKASGVTADDTYVLGGTGALSDEQAQKVIGSTEAINPWAFEKTTAELRKDVQLAAIKYLGTDAWQKGDVILQPDPDKARYGFFGLNDSGAAVAGTLQDVRQVTDVPKTPEATSAKVFTGFKGTADKIEKNAQELQTLGNTKKSALDAEVAKASKGGSAEWKAGGTCAAPTVTAVATMTPAYADYFGKAEVLPTLSCTTVGTKNVYKVTNADKASYTFDADGVFTGLNMAVIDKIKKDAKDVAATAAVGDANKAPASTYPQGVKDSLMAIVAQDHGIASDSATDTINWPVLTELANAQAKTQRNLEELYKAELAKAVAAFNAHSTSDIVAQAAGVKRIGGKDRYETSARVAYWGVRFNAVPITELYLASGEETNLIDSVVAGQLNKGSIVLVPRTGELPESTKNHMGWLITSTKAAGAGTPLTAGFVIGGTGAVSDDMVKAAVSALK